MLLPDRAALCGSDPSGADQANRFIMVLLALQRVAYLFPAGVSAANGTHRSPTLHLLLLFTAVAWNVALFRSALRRGWFSSLPVYLDVLFSVVLLVVVDGHLAGEVRQVVPTWVDCAAEAAAALAAAVIAPPLFAVTVVLALIGTQVAVTVAENSGGGTLIPELVYATNGIAGFAVVAGVGIRYLRCQGRMLDRINLQRSVAEAERAADQARYATRVAHHRFLHDTVLTTLTLIARGGVDHRAEQVRQRCARDAEYIRGLLTDPVDTTPGTVTEALGQVVNDVSPLGLRVRYRSELAPPDVPPHVVEAFRDATREALNNVVKHAGVDEAWLTVTGVDDVLRVTVVDRGRGFDPDGVRPGFGFRNSVVERVAEVGGRVRVSSEPGAGTCVELSWPR
ncbi:sensor histidine kinase [Micromonospora echinofusca]|uniref:histidine kinase n=1 Tax=Micromonospora echinofusca TaxID=47858 RepID=A0ABS3VK90_MICEH|nr:ATP-binding protein [Micromonospora echinofusca]MBO4204954.1 hypothetical protein [Micromonospora echinofusca]